MKKILLMGFVLGALVVSLLNSEGLKIDSASSGNVVQVSEIKVGG